MESGFGCPDVPDFSSAQSRRPRTPVPAPTPIQQQPAEEIQNEELPSSDPQDDIPSEDSPDIDEPLPQPQPLSQKTPRLPPRIPLGFAAASLAVVGIPLLVARLRSGRNKKKMARPSITAEAVQLAAGGGVENEEQGDKQAIAGIACSSPEPHNVAREAKKDVEHQADEAISLPKALSDTKSCLGDAEVDQPIACLGCMSQEATQGPPACPWPKAQEATVPICQEGGLGMDGLLKPVREEACSRTCSVGGSMAPVTPENEPSSPTQPASPLGDLRLNETASKGNGSAGNCSPGSVTEEDPSQHAEAGVLADAEGGTVVEPELAECPALLESVSPLRPVESNGHCVAGGDREGGQSGGSAPRRKSIELRLGQETAADDRRISVKLAVMSFELPSNSEQPWKALQPVEAPVPISTESSLGSPTGRVQRLIQMHSQAAETPAQLGRSLSRTSLPPPGSVTPEWPPQRKFSDSGFGSLGRIRSSVPRSVDPQALSAAGIDLTANAYTALFYFRGTWCPEDRAQLRQLSDEGLSLRAQGISLHCITAEPGGKEELVARLQDRCVRGNALLEAVDIHCDPNLSLCARPFDSVHSTEAVAAKQRFGGSYEDYVMVQPALVVLDADGAVKLWWSWLTMEAVDTSDPMAHVRTPGTEDFAPLVSLRPVPLDIIPAIEAGRTVNVHSVTHQGIHGTPLHKV